MAFFIYGCLLVGSHFQLAVQNSIQAAPKLAFSAPSNLKIEIQPSEIRLTPGQKQEIEIKINRRNQFQGNITVSAEDEKALPAELKIRPLSQKTTESSCKVVIKAKADLKNGTYDLKFSARDDSGKVLHIQSLKVIIQRQ